MRALTAILLSLSSLCLLAHGQHSHVSSVPTNTDVQGKFHARLSAEQKQHILDGRCTVITSTASMPRALRESFAIVTREKQLELADPNHKYQSTDVVTTPSLPVRRLVFAGSCGDKPFVYYEHGGYGHGYAILIFRPDSNGLPQFLWGGVNFQRAKDVDALRAAIASGTFADGRDYYW